MTFDRIPSHRKSINRSSLVALALGALLIAAPVSFGLTGFGSHQAYAQGEGGDRGGSDKGGAESGGGSDRGGTDKGGAESGGSAGTGGVDTGSVDRGATSTDISRDVAAR